MNLKTKITITLLTCLIFGTQAVFTTKILHKIKKTEKTNSSLIKQIEVLTKENEIITKEIKNLKSRTETNRNFTTKFIGDHILTFYTHTGNRTASGVYPKAGRTVAVDTRYIPHGTILYIEGIGFRIAEDTGGDIKGNRLDVFVDSKEEAIRKGVKKAKVHVVKGIK